ncbi:hypothetical protein LEN26_002856 [Aphanomyces euteiches]|nr:hypothetical protein AeMF1_002125 [Aphanomyces euteiches]KAH9158600.1 hypothetical protein LEN26_002856 [Aphanomyces euteiches]KAH9187112.1 hypothetical protein AeNC1_010912 [Aphanomyces euteiches]
MATSVQPHEFRLDLHASRPTCPVLSQTLGRHILLQRAALQQYGPPQTSRPRSPKAPTERGPKTARSESSSATPTETGIERIWHERQARMQPAEQTLEDTTAASPAVETVKRFLHAMPHNRVQRRIVSQPMRAFQDETMPMRRRADDKDDATAAAETEMSIAWLKKQAYLTRKGRAVEQDHAAFLARPTPAMRSLHVELTRAIDASDDARDLERRLLFQKRMKLKKTMRDTAEVVAHLKTRRAHDQIVAESEIDACQERIDAFENALALLQTSTAENSAALGIEERKLNHELEAFESKMERWDNPNPIDRARHQSLLRGAARVPTEPRSDAVERVRALDALLRQSGGDCGGWDAVDHAAFLTCLHQSGWKEAEPDALELEAFVDRCTVPGKSKDAVRTHVEWFMHHTKLMAEKRQAIVQWRQAKMQQTSAAHPADDIPPPPSKPNAEDEDRRAQRQLEAKAKVQAWKAAKRQQEVAGSTNQHVETQQRRRPLDALSRLETKQKVALYKLQKEEAKAREAASAHAVKSLARPSSKSLLEQSSARDLAAAKSKFERQQSKQQAMQAATALPDRPNLPCSTPRATDVYQPTKASSARAKTPQDIRDEAASRQANGAHGAVVPGGAGAAHVKGRSFGHVPSQPRSTPAWRRHVR